jgi:hypothetical protein
MITVSQLRPDMVETAPPLPRAPDLTDPQRYAMVLAVDDELSRKIRAHIDQWGWPYPSRDDWRALVERGYVVKNHHCPRFHRIMPLGRVVATEIMRELARKIGLHHVTIGNRPGSQAIARCICGWSIGLPRTPHVEHSLSGHAADHLAAAAYPLPLSTPPQAVAAPSAPVNCGAIHQPRIAPQHFSAEVVGHG